MTLLQAVADVFPTVIKWIWKVKNQLFNPVSHFGPLMTMFWIAVSISALFLGIKIIRSLIWGK